MIKTFDLTVYYTDLEGKRQVTDFFGISRVAVLQYTRYYQSMYTGVDWVIPPQTRGRL